MVKEGKLSTYIQDEALKDVEQDTFGHEHVADAVVESILDTAPPFIVGIFGGWGTGKSSLLGMISQKLTDDKIANVTIDAWRYTATDNLQRAFLVHVAKKLAPKLLDGLRTRLYTTEQETIPFKTSDLERLANITRKQIYQAVGVFFFGSLVMAVLLFTLLAIPVLATDGNLANFDWKNLADKYASGIFVPLLLAFFSFLRLYVIERPVTVIHERIDADELFYEYFEKAVNEATKSKETKKQKLVIFVDNLDRLSDEKMVSALESLKTYISNDKCIFVVACDDNVVRTVINNSEQIPAREGELDGRAGEHYLDKFFQQTFRLPEYLRINLFDFAVRNFQTTKLCYELKSRNVEIKNLISIILPSDISSPRKVKRLLNEFIALYEIVERREDEAKGQLRKGLLTQQPEFLAKFATIRAEFPKFYQRLIQETSILIQISDQIMLKNEQEASNIIGSIYKDATESKEAKSLLAYLRKTVTVSTKDIEAYIWLSQDTLALGLKQDDLNRIRTYLPDGDIDQFSLMLDEIKDDDYRSRLIETTTRFVQENSFGIDQQNGVKVLASILPTAKKEQKSEIAQVAVNLIPNFSPDSFSAGEILNVMRWAKTGISNQRDALTNRIVDLLRKTETREETTEKVFENADVIEMQFKTSLFQKWFSDFFGLKLDAFFQGNKQSKEAITPEEMAKQVTEFGDFLSNKFDQLTQNPLVLDLYYRGGYLTFLVDTLLGVFQKQEPIPLDQERD